jgi:phosphonate transport system permease protein
VNLNVYKPPRTSDQHNSRNNNVATLRRVSSAIAFTVALILCWRFAEIRPSAIFEPGAASGVLTFIRSLFPPDLSPGFLRIVAAATLETLAIAIAGTALSVLFSLPLAIVATPTLWQRGILIDGDPPSVTRSLLSAISRATRALFGFVRAVPDLMWGLLFVVAVGLGSVAGTLALAISYSGVLGRVYADVFEDVDPRALEALHGVGASRFQVFLRAIWPQAVPSITGYTIYSFECCVRAASVLGFIGAGGIGYEINLSMRMFNYGEVLTLIVSLFALVGTTDAISRFIRRRLNANVPEAFLSHKGLRRVRGYYVRGPKSFTRLPGTVALISALVVGWSFYRTGFLNTGLIDSELPRRVVGLIAEMFPPDLDFAFLQSLLFPLLQTVGISVIGTLIGISLSIALSLPAASTLILKDKSAAGRNSLFGQTLRWIVYLSARLVLNVLRSIPELVWVLVCIIAVGLGPYAGTLAIGLHTGGVLGKLYAETLEQVPSQPIEALRANGARPLQVLIWGIWPLLRPTLISYTVLRWETNLRVSTILGLVGGGGLGQAIYNNIQLGFYQRVTVLIVLIYALVMTTNWIGDRLRNRPVSFNLARLKLSPYLKESEAPQL